jgi:hypothetical protein
MSCLVCDRSARMVMILVYCDYRGWGLLGSGDRWNYEGDDKVG